MPHDSLEGMNVPRKPIEQNSINVFENSIEDVNSFDGLRTLINAIPMGQEGYFVYGYDDMGRPEKEGVETVLRYLDEIQKAPRGANIEDGLVFMPGYALKNLVRRLHEGK